MAKVYRADHVGSLLRPPELLQARAAFDAGQLLLDQLRQAEDNAILQAIELQRQAGIEVVSDGEYRRSGWFGDFFDSVEGYVNGPLPIAFEWQLPDEMKQA